MCNIVWCKTFGFSEVFLSISNFIVISRLKLHILTTDLIANFNSLKYYFANGKKIFHFKQNLNASFIAISLTFWFLKLNPKWLAKFDFLPTVRTQPLCSDRKWKDLRFCLEDRPRWPGCSTWWPTRTGRPWSTCSPCSSQPRLWLPDLSAEMNKFENFVKC